MGIGPAFQGGDRLQLFFGFLGVVPEIRGMGLFFLLLYFCKLAVDVKDTSPGRWYALLTLLCCQW
jgi:hypothetical protein